MGHGIETDVALLQDLMDAADEDSPNVLGVDRRAVTLTTNTRVDQRLSPWRASVRAMTSAASAMA